MLRAALILKRVPKKAVPLGIEMIAKFEEGDAFIVTVNADKHRCLSISVKSRRKISTVEKPGGLSSTELDLKASTIDANASIYIAYNRRFYASVIQAKKIIREDGGHFRVHLISPNYLMRLLL